MRRRFGFGFLGLLLLAGGTGLYLKSINETLPGPLQVESITQPAETEQPAHPTDTPDSLWVIVNKSRPLPEAYRPIGLEQPAVLLNEDKTQDENSLRTDAARAVELLFKEAQSTGYELMLASGFRSVEQQKIYYDNYVALVGQEAANRVSARPGHSEHQTGLALDIARADRFCYIDLCFAETGEGRWLKANAHRFGFIIRYPEGKQAVTGYSYEPWHFRYVGADLAAELQKSGLTMEEHFKIQ